MKNFIDILKEEKIIKKSWGELQGDDRGKALKMLKAKKLVKGVSASDAELRKFVFMFNGDKLGAVALKK